MKDEYKTKAKLISELKELRGCNKELEALGTEYKRAEEEKEQAKIYLERSLESIPDGVVLLDKQGRFSYVNPTFLEWMGRESDEFIGKSFTEISFPFTNTETINIMLERVKRRLKTGETTTGTEVEIIGPDGKPRQQSYSAAGIKDEKGNILGEVIFMKDISDLKRVQKKLLDARENLEQRVEERTRELKRANDLLQREILERKRAEEALRRAHDELEQRVEERTEELARTTEKLKLELTERRFAEEALRESEEKFRSLFDTTRDAIFIANASTGIIIEANDAASILMDIPKEHLIGKHQSDLHPSEEAENYRQIFAEHVRSGKAITADISVQRPGGECIAVDISASTFYLGKEFFIQGVFRDISERKRVEQMKDTLLRDVSHELKHPVAMAIMELEVLKRKLVGKENIKEYTEALDKNLQRLKKEIHRIMEFSQYDVSEDSLKMSSLSLQTILDEVVEEFREDSLIKGIEIAIQSEPRLPEVYGIQDQLHRLLQNLVENALKFNLKDGKIEISVKPKDRFMEVRVQDTGHGISPENLPMVFERFFRGHGSITGVGLGLTICKDIVENHRGQIWIESEGEGKGTTVIFTLPIAQIDN